MSKIGKALLIIFFTALPAFAQPITSVEQIPPLDRTQADFYGAIVGAGPRVQIEWLLSPATVERGADAILTLIVSNATNPNELQRPNLKERPEFRELFEVTEDAGTEMNGKRVAFRYKLRARNEGAFAIPLPKYRYYQPQAPDGRRFQLATAPELTLTVTKPPPAKNPVAVAVTGPEEFFRLPAWWHDARTESPPLNEWRNPVWIAVILLPLIVSMFGILLYRLRYPDAVKKAVLLRRREVRSVLKRLSEAGNAEAIEVAINSYLQVRWQISTRGLSAREKRDAFAEVSHAEDNAASLHRIFERCDQLRFGGGGDSISAEEATAWVLKVEAESK